MLRQLTVILTLALGLSAAAHAETVEVTRVSERLYPAAITGSFATCDCCRGQATGLHIKVYEVIYARDGKMHSQVLTRHPGQMLELDRQGQPITLAFDNPK